MKSMMLFLLGVRMLFLVLACFGCIFAIISGLRTGVEWYWPAGGVLGLGLCGFLSLPVCLLLLCNVQPLN